RRGGIGKVVSDGGTAVCLPEAAELAVGADLARHPRYFGGERIELVHHRIDGVLELEDFAADIDRDLAGQVAARNRCRHLRDVARSEERRGGREIEVRGEALQYA